MIYVSYIYKVNDHYIELLKMFFFNVFPLYDTIYYLVLVSLSNFVKMWQLVQGLVWGELF